MITEKVHVVAPRARSTLWRCGTLAYTGFGLAALFAWLLLGDFAWQLKERGSPSLLQLLLRKYHASNELVGFYLLSVPSAFSVLVAPVIAYKSDRLRSRWGRRVPYLFYAAALGAGALIMLAFSPALGAYAHAILGDAIASLDTAVLAVMGVAWMLISFSGAIFYAIFGALVNDVVPREYLGRFFGLFRAVALGAGIYFNYSLIGMAEERSGMLLIAIGTALALAVGLMCLMVKEGGYEVESAPESGCRGLWIEIKGYWSSCFGDSFFRRLLLGQCFAQLAFVPINLYSLYAAASFGIALREYGRYTALFYVCSLAFAVPLGYFADRFHPLRLGVVLIASYGASMALGFYFLRGGGYFGVIFVMHGVISGAYFTGSAAIGQMLYPKEKFAQFAAAGGFVSGICGMALGPALGAVVDRMGGDYTVTFGISAIIALTALLILTQVHREFARREGPLAYAASK